MTFRLKIILLEVMHCFLKILFKTGTKILTADTLGRECAVLNNKYQGRII